MSSYMGRCSAEVRFIDYDPSVAWLFVDCTLELSCCPGNGQPPAGQCAMAPFGNSTKTRYDTLNPSGSKFTLYKQVAHCHFVLIFSNPSDDVILE